jgi:hypothetical protein
MPIQVTLTRTVNICYFLLIRHGNELALMDRLFALGFSTTIAIAWISTVYCAANVYKAGKINIISTRLVKFHPDDTKGRKLFRMTKLALKPVRFHVGDFYTIRPFTVLKVASGFLYGTSRLLLTFRKNKNRI